MSILESDFKRKFIIIAFGIISIPLAYASIMLDPAFNHFTYESLIILTIAYWVIVSIIAYFIVLSIRVRRGTAQLRGPPNLKKR